MEKPVDRPLARLVSFLRELRRRNVYRVAVAYLAVAFVSLQAAQILVPATTLPAWADDLLVYLAIFGFPVALVLAWALEITPDGIRRTAPVGSESPVPAQATAGEGSDRVGGHAPPAARPGKRRAAYLLVAGILAMGGLGYGGMALLGSDERPDDRALRVRSLAVLPLDNYTGDAAQQYLVDGMHEALIHELTRIEELTVKSRTSVMRFRGQDATIPSLPEIVRQLGGVDRVVEGSVFQFPGSDSLRVTVQLIDGATDEHLWSRTYHGELRRLRALEARVARGIAREIHVDLGPEERDSEAQRRTVAPDAVDLYMRARAEWRAGTPESMEHSISLYRQALEIEPGYALAWAGMADAYLVLAHVRLPAREAFPEAREAAQRALELDGELAQAHTALADTRFHYDWDWEGAEEGFRRALELNPGYDTARWWYSGLLAALGRMEESVAEITRARELDPLSPQSHGFAVRILYYARHFEDALDVVERIRELGVQEFMMPPWAALAHHALGDTDRALALLDAIPEAKRSPYARAALAQVLAAEGSPARARQEIGVLERAYRDGRLHLPHLVAVGYAALGERDRALDWLETAAEDRDGALPWLTVEPAFDRLRFEPRFRALVDRMGLETSADSG